MQLSKNTKAAVAGVSRGESRVTTTANCIHPILRSLFSTIDSKLHGESSVGWSGSSGFLKASSPTILLRPGKLKPTGLDLEFHSHSNNNNNSSNIHLLRDGKYIWLLVTGRERG